MKNVTTITVSTIWFAVLTLISFFLYNPEIFEPSHHVMGYGEVSNALSIICLALPFAIVGVVLAISYAVHVDRKREKTKAFA